MILNWEVVVLLFLQLRLWAPVDGTCSGHEYIKVNYAGSITSPNYGTGNYPTNQNCSWHIEGTSNGMLVYYIRAGIDCSDSVIIYEGCDETGTVWPRPYCGTRAIRRVFVSGGSVFAQFLSDNETTSDGFAIFYTSGSQENVGTACNGGHSLTANSTAQYLTSPNFPNKYPMSTVCLWNITGEDGKNVKLEVLYIDVEADNCQYDYLLIANGEGVEIEKLCVRNSWQLRTYVNESFNLRLFSDDVDVGSYGFVISFITVEEETTTQMSTTTIQSQECNYPLEWQSNTMTDSVEGIVNFTATTISGWKENTFGVTLSEWTCYQKYGNLIISRSVNKATTIYDYYVYMCLQILNTENNVYTYKLISAKDSDSQQSRVVPIQEATTPSFPSACNEEDHNETRTLTIEVEETTTEQATTSTMQETTSTQQETTSTQQESTTTTETTPASISTTQSQSTTGSQECNYPLEWQSNTMTDSVEGIVNFTATTISGWKENTFGVTLSEWMCYQKYGNLIISRSVDKATTIYDYYVYMCLQILNTENNVYTYKLISAKDSDSQQSRVVPIQEATTPSFPSACNEEDHNETRTLTIEVEETTTEQATTSTMQETTSTQQETTSTQQESTTTTETTPASISTTQSQTTTGSQVEETTTEQVTTTASTTPQETTTTPETTTQTESTTPQETTTTLETTTQTESTTPQESTTTPEMTTQTELTTPQETTTTLETTTQTESTTPQETTTTPATTTQTESTTPQETTTTLETTTQTESTTPQETTTTQATTTQTESTTTTQQMTTTTETQSTTAKETTTTETITTTIPQTTTEYQSTRKTETTTELPSTTKLDSTTPSQTTTVQGSTLSPGAQIAVVSGVVGGLSVLFLIGALVVVVIFAFGKRPAKKAYRKDSNSSPSRSSGRDKVLSESVPAWITMIDSLKGSGYNPYFYNDQKSGKWSGERLNEV